MSGLRYAYNTNGLQGHRLTDALDLLADSGYAGVALTLDHAHLDPFAPDWQRAATAVRQQLDERGLGCVVETGARFLLDPRAKHEPTLVSATAEERARRIAFLRRCSDVAAVLGAEAVSFWAGVSRALDDAAAWPVLVEGVRAVVADAVAAGVRAALEPEPGMLVEDLDGYLRLHEEVGPDLHLALDTGHCVVTGRHAPDEAVREGAAQLATVTVEDMPRGVHEHLPPGEGDVDLVAVLAALTEIRWAGLVCVELSRDSHRADVLVPRVLQQLRALEGA